MIFINEKLPQLFDSLHGMLQFSDSVHSLRVTYVSLRFNNKNNVEIVDDTSGTEVAKVFHWSEGKTWIGMPT